LLLLTNIWIKLEHFLLPKRVWIGTNHRQLRLV
jgi:hypothetical protein